MQIARSVQLICAADDTTTIFFLLCDPPSIACITTDQLIEQMVEQAEKLENEGEEDSAKGSTSQEGSVSGESGK